MRPLYDEKLAFTGLNTSSTGRQRSNQCAPTLL
jgi:hypothetical protein